MEERNVIAVVVTHNRLPLLQRCVASLRANAPGRIIVVDNGSTDGTGAWLDAQEGLHVIHQDNVGGSGGFHRGMDEARRLGAAWIWCMDDDVFPRPGCLHELLSCAATTGAAILAPRRLLDGHIYTNDFRGVDLTHPFASLYTGRLATDPPDGPTPIAGTAFEGPLVSRDVVERIGLPNKDLFIFCDDTDYCLRAGRAGFKIVYVPTALMDKQPFFSEDDWATRNRKKKWKRFYQVRNATYLNHHYGRTWGVRCLRGFMGMAGYALTALVTAPFSDAYTWGDIPRFWRAWRDGMAERLGKMPLPDDRPAHRTDKHEQTPS